MRGNKIVILLYGCIVVWLFGYSNVVNASAGDVVINEVAWSGTKASASDEWIELFNNTNTSIDLTGWKIFSGGATAVITLKGSIEPNGYYLIERTNDSTVQDSTADVFGSFGGNGLSNEGELLQLKNADGAVIDEVAFGSKWPAGSASPQFATMERISSSASGSESANWLSNNGTTINGIDAKGNPIRGTPRRENSVKGMSGAPPEPSNSDSTTSTPTETTRTVSSNSVSGGSSNQPPVITLDDTIIQFAGASVLLEGAKIARDLENAGMAFVWNFGDGETSNKTTIDHKYQKPGSYILSVAVSDGTTEAVAHSFVKIYSPLVVINEFVPNPKGSDAHNEWIELYNGEEFPIDVSGFIIEAGKKSFILPKQTLLSPKNYVVLMGDITKMSLKNADGVVRFLTPEKQVIQEIKYTNTTEGASIARKNSAYLFSELPTPGTANVIYGKGEKTLEGKSDKSTSSAVVTNDIIAINAIAEQPAQLTSFKVVGREPIIARKPITAELDSLVGVPIAQAIEQKVFPQNNFSASIANTSNRLTEIFGYVVQRVFPIVLIMIGSGFLSIILVTRWEHYKTQSGKENDATFNFIEK